jgi:hypothetical protein
VAAIRARFPGKTLVGAVARAEKIANRDYLAAVTGILQRHPQAVFLWTGNSELAEITAAFQAAGVADRCHFLGWVDPTPYILAFDLFLETFPLTGITAAWSMALGKPMLSVGSLGFMAVYLEPIFDGKITIEPADLARLQAIFAPVRDRLPGLWARDASQIAPLADALLADPALAQAFGRAQQAYMQAFMGDEPASAAAQARHFAAIAREARVRLSASPT